MFKTKTITRKEACDILNGLSLIVMNEVQGTVQNRKETRALPQYSGHRVRRQIENLSDISKDYQADVLNARDKAEQEAREITKQVAKDKSVQLVGADEIFVKNLKSINEQKIKAEIITKPFVITEKESDFGSVEFPSQVFTLLPDYILQVK